jgi:hypothetical protein
MSALDPLRSLRPLIRSHTAAEWADADYELLNGELGIESDTGKMKYGAGRIWSSTPYFTPTGFTGTATINAEEFVFVNGILTAINPT